MWCMGVLCPHQKTKERRKQHEAFCEQQHDDGDVHAHVHVHVFLRS